MADNTTEELSLFGKGFEDIDEKESVSKRPLSIENQVVTDEKGRRRFHGAFTGGFSAGHFNTVGSVDGWTPSAFKSGRSIRTEKTGMRPEDFMDQEDLGEFGIAPRTVRTTKTFTDEDAPLSKDLDRKNRLAWDHSELAVEADRILAIIKPVNDSIGATLLKKMGWRPGKGVGPTISKKMTPDELHRFVPANFKFAPEDINFHTFDIKSDIHGLGYCSLASSALLTEGNLQKEIGFTSNKKKGKGIHGQAFGVGAFEEDDQDIYGVDDLSKYDFALDTEASSCPTAKNQSDIYDNFVPAANLLPPRKFFQPPKLSRDYVPKCPFFDKRPSASMGRPSLPPRQPAQRASMLGNEAPSIWSLVSAIDRQRITTAVTNFSTTAPHANEATPRRSRFDLVPSDSSSSIGTNDVTSRQSTMTSSHGRDFVVESASPQVQSPFASGSTNRSVQEDQDKLKAVQMKMFGSMTREKHEWHPHQILCKRFNVPNPFIDSSICGVPHLRKATDRSSKNSLFEATADELENRRFFKLPLRNAAEEQSSTKEVVEAHENLTEKNDTSLAEAAGPPLNIFQAIFAASDTEKSDSSDNETLHLQSSSNSKKLASIATNKSCEEKTEFREEKVSSKISSALVTLAQLRKEECALPFYGPALPPVVSESEISIACNLKSPSTSENYSGKILSDDRTKRQHKKHSKKHKKSQKSRRKTKSRSASSSRIHRTLDRIRNR